jgi:hypothetical protein
VNYRTLIAALVLAGPVLAVAADPSPAPSSPPAPGVAAQGVPPALAAPAPEMRAFLTQDGRQIAAPLLAEESASLAIAKVDDETITLRQLMTSLGMAHKDRHEGQAKQHDFKPALDRLIDIKLCVLEAREMALDELPEVKQSIQQESESELVGRVRARAIQGVKASQADVDRLYRDAVREWKLHSLLFDREAEANAFQAELKRGKDFETLGKTVVAAKKAKGTVEAAYSPAGALLPQVVQFVSTAKVGASQVLRVKQGWSVVQVLGTRYPENADARAAAEAKGLEVAQQRAAKRYYESLEKKYARIDRKLLKSLDFEAPKPGFAALKKDQRPLATIPGEKPFTVADLAAGLEMKFFHGIEAPIKEHRANSARYEAFETLLRKRLVMKEAQRLDIASSDAFRRHMAEFTDATLFTAYVERSILPEVKVTEKEGQEYYAKHKGEFTSPAMYRLESLAFTNAKDAQGALDKLRSGTDFKWLRANATGQLKDDDRSVQIDGNVVSANALTPDLRAQLAGTKAGDYRLAQIEGQYYVVRVVSASPPQEQSYKDSRSAIGKKLIGENLQKVLVESAAKLRKAHAVTVYLTRIGY